METSFDETSHVVDAITSRHLNGDNLNDTNGDVNDIPSQVLEKVKQYTVQVFIHFSVFGSLLLLLFICEV